MKIGKISVRHYLNEELKPYAVIDGVPHYTVYILVRAQNKNTKIKSHALRDCYSHEDFEKAKDPKGPGYKSIQEETVLIERVIDIMMRCIGQFDTKLFAAVYAHLNKITVKNIRMAPVVIKWEEGSSIIDIERHDWLKNVTIEGFYSNSIQTRMKEQLCGDSYDKGCMSIVNEKVFRCSMLLMRWIFSASKKNKLLTQEYPVLFGIDDE